MAEATERKPKKVNHADRTLEVSVLTGFASAAAMTQTFELTPAEGLSVAGLFVAAAWGVGKMVGQYLESRTAGRIASGSIGAMPLATIVYRIADGSIPLPS